MSTISVPLKKDQEETLDTLVRNGVGENRAAVMRKGLEQLAQTEAVEAVLLAQREPTLKGDLRSLMKKL
ncbi:MAG: hypothetical protein NT019_01620 [Candidatus Adlerbacteria bacterium]|nr:hypothetical protein [Candidatus Adlerbacteria bacterium]